MRENADQNNSEYGHFLRSVNTWIFSQFISIYHSICHDCCQMYIMSLAMSYYLILECIMFTLLFLLCHVCRLGNM